MWYDVTLIDNATSLIYMKLLCSTTATVATVKMSIKEVNKYKEGKFYYILHVSDLNKWRGATYVTLFKTSSCYISN